jgi:hypothetical protein
VFLRKPEGEVPKNLHNRKKESSEATSDTLEHFKKSCSHRPMAGSLGTAFGFQGRRPTGPWLQWPQFHLKRSIKSEVRPIHEAQRYSDCWVRASPLRSHHNTRKSGISESMKKSGPPRRWIRL